MVYVNPNPYFKNNIAFFTCTVNAHTITFFLSAIYEAAPTDREFHSWHFKPAKTTKQIYHKTKQTRHCVLSVLRRSSVSSQKSKVTHKTQYMTHQQNLLKAETTSAAIVGVAGGEYKVAEPSASEVAYFADTEGISKCHIAHISIAQCSADSFFSLNLH